MTSYATGIQPVTQKARPFVRLPVKATGMSTVDDFVSPEESAPLMTALPLTPVSVRREVGEITRDVLEYAVSVRKKQHSDARKFWFL